MKVTYITDISGIEQISQEDKEVFAPITDKFAFRTNNYYNSLINWDDPNDPIKRLILPHKDELDNWGNLDASDEASYQPVQGVEHKYQETALLLCNDVCAAYCRFCFRKRLFQNDNDEVVKDVAAGVAYIREHPEIRNVLLTGGDPLVLSTKKLEKILSQLCEIEHIRYIRIGTKMAAFNPFRILNDSGLIEMIESYNARKQIYIMSHFNHPVEFTPEAMEALKLLRKAGAEVVNQTPIIRGINDCEKVLNELFSNLANIGIQPYYVFACRPTEGNKAFAVPVEQAYEIYEKARMKNSGLAKTARFVMSHRSGKIEVVGLTEKLIMLKHHNVVDHARNGSVFFCQRNPEAYWFDDYKDMEVDIDQAVAALLPQPQ